MVKKIVIDKKPTKQSIEAIDQWVESGSVQKTQVQQNQNTNLKEKKITLNVSEELHKKIKIYCTHNNYKIKDKLLEILEKEFS